MSKVALIILDGYGIGNQDENNAIWMAKTPVMDKLMGRSQFKGKSPVDPFCSKEYLRW